MQSRVSARGLGRAVPIAARDVSYLLVALVALFWSFYVVRWSFANEAIGFDFEGTLWDAGVAVREGRSPYPAPVLSEVDVNNPALYPPLLPLLVAPLTVLPWSLGVTIWVVLLGSALALTLYALDVRDPRCYALALLSAPAANGLVYGNVTLLLIPLVALSWRWRDRWLRSGALIGLAIASKLFFWPLVFWLLGTRRYRAAGAAVGAAVAGIIVPWTIVGFDGLATYPDLLRIAADIFGTHSFSVTTMLSALGVETELATTGAPVVGLTLAVLAFLAGRRNADEISVSIAALAAILASPIVWDYNYALLLIPLALVWPRLSFAWLVLPLLHLAQELPVPWLPAAELEPGGTACCRPDDVPEAFWNFVHAPSALWPALGRVALAAALIAFCAWTLTRQKPSTVT